MVARVSPTADICEDKVEGIDCVFKSRYVRLLTLCL